MCFLASAVGQVHAHKEPAFARTLLTWEQLKQHFDSTLNQLHPFPCVTALDYVTYNVKQMLQ